MATSLLLTALLLVPAICGLRVTQGSPCTSVCPASTNTTGNDIVCLDAQFNSSPVGSSFQSCITCELGSTYANQQTGESDVLWGLYNLRFAFSACVYGFPVQVTNVSTPCLVSCQPLISSLEFGLTSPTSLTYNTYCGVSSFADNLVSTCEYCYALTSEQAYLANFLEAVRYNCHFMTTPGTSFAIDPSRIFNITQLPASTGGAQPSQSATSSGGTNNLALIIALPVVGFVIILALVGVCCFFLIRRQRRKAKERRAAQMMHYQWNDGAGSWGEFPLRQGPFAQGFSSPVYGPGLDQSFAPYSTTEFATIPAPGQVYQPHLEKPDGHEQHFFPPPPSIKS